MSDQCIHCTARGNLAECEMTDCGWHDLWYVVELRSKLAAAEADNERLRAVLSERAEALRSIGLEVES